MSVDVDHLRKDVCRRALPGAALRLVDEPRGLGAPVMQQLDERGNFKYTCNLPPGCSALLVQVFREKRPGFIDVVKLLVLCEGRVGWVDWIDVAEVEGRG